MGFLRPVKMARVGLLGLKEDRERIVSFLHDSGVVQVEPLRKEALAILPSEAGGDLQRRVSEELLRFRTLKAALPTRRAAAPIAYPTLEGVLQATGRIAVDSEVTGLKAEEDRLLTERASLAETIQLLEAHRYYREPLALLRSRALLAFFGEAGTAAFDRLRGEIDRLAPSTFITSVGAKQVWFVLAVPTEQAEAVGRLAQQAGVRLTGIPSGLEGRIDEELPRCRDRVAQIDARLGEIRGRLGQIADQWQPAIASIEEALTIENRKFEAWSRMGAGSHTFTLEGWVPVRDLPRVEQGLATLTQGRATVFPIATDEEPPTLMDNPPGIRWYEFFIRFYAIPKGTEFDPTWIFAIAFPVFFGFMLGDAGYALVILGFCLWMIAGFPGRGGIPKFFKGIPTMIMGPSSMQSLARTLVPGCLIGVGIGVYYNNWFGFQLPFYRIVSPIDNVGTLLLIGGYFGLLMVIAGFFLGILKAMYHHHPREAVARFSGILLALGFAGLGLMLIRHTLSIGAITGTNALLSDVWLALLVVAVGLLIAAEGGQGIMSIPEVLSHILSYSRLIGILLSAVILATIVNIGYWGFVTRPASSVGEHAGFVLAGVLILIMGQVFVLILAVFEPGIQGARLIFVEHFSKFYEGNGRPFMPFRSPRTYTRPQIAGDEPHSLIVGPGSRSEGGH
jgi:V/A-type H+/Na+-transporting ATPase subunit I